MPGMVQNWRGALRTVCGKKQSHTQGKGHMTSLEGAVCLAQGMMAVSYEMPWVHDEGRDERGVKGVQTEHQGMPRKC